MEINTDRAARSEIENLKKTIKQQETQIASLQKALGRMEAIVRAESKKTMRAHEYARQNRSTIQSLTTKVAQIGKMLS